MLAKDQQMPDFAKGYVNLHLRCQLLIGGNTVKLLIRGHIVYATGQRGPQPGQKLHFAHVNAVQ